MNNIIPSNSIYPDIYNKLNDIINETNSITSSLSYVGNHAGFNSITANTITNNDTLVLSYVPQVNTIETLDIYVSALGSSGNYYTTNMKMSVINTGLTTNIIHITPFYAYNTGATDFSISGNSLSANFYVKGINAESINWKIDYKII